METRSRRRAAAETGSAEQPPESPVTRSSSIETLNLTVITDDRAAGEVGPSHLEVGVSARLPGTSSPIQDARGASTTEGSQVPVREPVQSIDLTLVSATATQIPTLATTVATQRVPALGEATAPIPTLRTDLRIPTLISCGPGTQLEPGKFSPRAQKFIDEWNMYEDDHDNGYIDDDYAVNTEMGARETVKPSHRDALGYYTFRAPVTSPEMQGMWDRPRVLQPIGTSYFSEPRDSPRSQGSVKPKSKGSSRASSGASGVDFN